MDAPSVCPKCQAILLPNTHFCPNCGYKISDEPTTVGLGRQVWIYFVSLILPPFGLIWTWKYLRSGNSQQKRVGWIALILTIASIIITIWVTVGFLQGISSQINSVSNFSNLGL